MPWGRRDQQGGTRRSLAALHGDTLFCVLPRVRTQRGLLVPPTLADWLLGGEKGPPGAPAAKVLLRSVRCVPLKTGSYSVTEGKGQQLRATAER